MQSMKCEKNGKGENNVTSARLKVSRAGGSTKELIAAADAARARKRSAKQAALAAPAKGKMKMSKRTAAKKSG